jgi:hypothetical protein
VGLPSVGLGVLLQKILRRHLKVGLSNVMATKRRCENGIGCLAGYIRLQGRIEAAQAEGACGAVIVIVTAAFSVLSAFPLLSNVPHFLSRLPLIWITRGSFGLGETTRYHGMFRVKFLSESLLDRSSHPGGAGGDCQCNEAGECEHSGHVLYSHSMLGLEIYLVDVDYYNWTASPLLTKQLYYY